METKIKNIFTHKLFVTLSLVFLFTLLSFRNLSAYIRFDFYFFLLFAVLPFVIQKQDKNASLRYGIISFILLFLFGILKSNALFFFAFLCTLLFIYEYQYGKLSLIPLFLVLIISPVSVFLSKVIGFEIRLFLTQIAAKALQFIDDNYNYSGNIITFGEKEFHIDPECMGLNLVLFSLFITLLLIAYRQQQKKGRMHPGFIVLSLFISYLLVILSNLFRIILITLFQAPPETFLHECIGIICFITYVFIPQWFIIKYLPIKNNKNPKINTRKPNKIIFIAILFIQILLFSLFRFTSIGEKQENETKTCSPEHFSNYASVSIEKHNVLKLTDPHYLIYIKPPVHFYSSDHSPLICWKGSGYQIRKEQIISIRNHKIYYSELKQGKDTLFSTWWYDSGSDKTISQYKWRLNSLFQGDSYHLINVISDNKDDLIKKSEQLLSEQIFP